jgi:hypothetical protein
MPPTGAAFLDWAREVSRVRLQVVARRDGGRQHTWATAGAPRRVVTGCGGVTQVGR